MATILWWTTTFLALHAAHSYILLTANMDDVQAIAKQMLASPMVNQIGKIWRRATEQFNQRLNDPKQPPMRHRADYSPQSDSDDNNRREHQRLMSEISTFGKDASAYLKTLRRDFNKMLKE